MSSLPDRPGAGSSGSADLRLPEELRGPLHAHLSDLREKFLRRGWGERVGFGRRPALVVIDLARYWLDPGQQIGSNLDAVVDATCAVLRAARAAQIPIFFTTYAYDPADPPNPHHGKFRRQPLADAADLFALDPRLERRPSEKVIRKSYASAFQGTNFLPMLAALGVDTLLVTGVSTSHCVYATCRDAAHTFRVIVVREAVGERCELLHEVNLLDIDIDLGDVTPLAEVVGYLQGLHAAKP